MRRQVVWINYSEQMTEKQYKVKTCTKSPKKGTPPIYGNSCSFDQKRKGCPIEVGMNRLKLYKSSNLRLILRKIVLSNSNLFLPATKLPNTWANFSPVPASDQKLMLKSIEIELFSVA